MPGRRNNATVKSSIADGGCNEKSNPLPRWFHRSKTYKICNYDTSRYPFRELLADWLEVLHDLENMHIPFQNEDSRQKDPLHPQVRHAHISAKINPALSSTVRRAKKKGLFSSPQYNSYIDTYRLFIREVIVPLCHDGENTDANSNSIQDDHVVYQFPPTTRVVFPNGNKTIAMHCDSEYPGHQAAEINFWLPVTKVYGSNSLWIESEPLKGDFKPVEINYGQFLRFDGHHCRHYTVQNETPSCRVSFDFRVIPSKLCADRSMMGDFCVEETTQEGYKTYWISSKKQKSPMPSLKADDKPLKSLLASLSLENSS